MARLLGRDGGFEMASVEVFVDDAVRGDLPYLCAKTGRPADGVQRMSVPVRTLGAAWLLVFVGPIGWIVLAVLATRGGDRLTVRLPWSHAAADAERSAARIRTMSLLVAAAALIADVGLGPDVVLGVVFLLAIAAAAAWHLAVQFRRIGIDLDASGRWVILRGVAPEFADAVEDEQRRDRDRSLRS